MEENSSQIMNNISDSVDIMSCKCNLDSFKNEYILYHGYISVCVCTFGIIANILNIVVLTRKEMISPTNAILTGLAVSDMLVMIAYLVFSIHYYVPPNRPLEEIWTYNWVVFTQYYLHFSVIFHGISTWQTVVLAVWRYIAVSFPSKNMDWCNMRRAKIAIISIYVSLPVIAIPNYIAFGVFSKISRRDIPKGNETYFMAYLVDFTSMARKNDDLLAKLSLWMFGILMKLIPCILLTILSLALIRALYAANRRRLILKNKSADSDKSGTDRVTGMLLAVLLIFLVTEFPAGILALLAGILECDFKAEVYDKLGEVLDILAVINSAVNFILYCTMSRLFRDTFSKLFKPEFKKWQWISIGTENALPIAQTKGPRISVTYNTTCL